MQTSLMSESLVVAFDVEVVVVLDVLDPVCVYTFICVEIKTNTEIVALRMFHKVQTTLVSRTRFF